MALLYLCDHFRNAAEDEGQYLLVQFPPFMERCFNNLRGEYFPTLKGELKLRLMNMLHGLSPLSQGPGAPL